MKKVFSIKKLIIFLLLLCVIVIGALIGTYFYLIGPVSNKGKVIEFEVKEGQTYSTIATELKNNGLIKSEIAYKIYLKLNTPENLEFGGYSLNTSYNLEELMEAFSKGSINLTATKQVTFVEGKNMRYVISTITENFSITEREILDKLSDKTYLDSLIDEYWFLTDEIKNKDIYYSLEGYLYPDTYEFYVTASLEDIFKTMLNTFESKIEGYKTEIENSKYTLHEMITLASIIELEAGNATDRKGVAGVFYNRLEDGWSLGSDVTTYYAIKLDNWLQDLKMSELNDCNAYNTRSTCMAGKLPVGPVCNPSLDSIASTITPTEHKYFYFVADKNGKTYFNETDRGHTNTVSKLKKDGLWIEYEN